MNQPNHARTHLISVLVLLCCLLSADLSAAERTATLTIRVNSSDGQPLPCRIHLTDIAGKSLYADDLPRWNDHFVCHGEATLLVAPGTIRYEVERGPEYDRQAGSMELTPGGVHQLTLPLQRISHVQHEGWYSGDLHVHRPVAEVPLLMQAEDLDYAPVITWWNQRNAWQKSSAPADPLKRLGQDRWYHVMAGEDEREGGALLYFGLNRPLNIQSESREFPSPMVFVQRARKIDPNVWIDIEKPFWWDVPVWLASGQMNSIGIANNHMCRSRMYEDEAWGRPRDDQRLPAPRGNGYWTQEIYYHLLNSGLRLPPSAGSASGVLPNPVGYNRVYVHLDEPFSRDAWFRGLARGESFVTNGPLLQVTANGRRPGAEFELTPETPQEFRIEVRTVSNDPLSTVELIHNGKIVQTTECSGATTESNTLTFTVTEPGWFLVRTVVDIDHTFRFASTAPWYVNDASGQPRVSRQSAQFFLDWVNERIERVNGNVTDEFQRPEVLRWHEMAREFWTERVRMADVD